MEKRDGSISYRAEPTAHNIVHDQDPAGYWVQGKPCYGEKGVYFSLDFGKVLALRKLAEQKEVKVDDLLRAAVDALLAAEGGGESGTAKQPE